MIALLKIISVLLKIRSNLRAAAVPIFAQATKDVRPGIQFVGAPLMAAIGHPSMMQENRTPGFQAKHGIL